LKGKAAVVWVAVVVFAGCDSCGTNAPPDGAGTEADGSGDGAVDTVRSDIPVVDTAVDNDSDDDVSDSVDGSPVDGADLDGRTATDVPCSGRQVACENACVDPETNPRHCGGCGRACSGRELCTRGACRCPRYHERCDGSCLPTHVDPNNCGECQRPCESSKVCSAGTCADSCLPGRTQCGQRCVDTSTDPDNCGGCGQTCADSEGCLQGSCHAAVDVGEAPSRCTGGGPQIDVRTTAGGQKRCLGNVAQTVFRWAVCSCDRLRFDNELRTDAYDSTLGRYRPGGLGGGVGTNGAIDAGSDLQVRGSVWAAGSRGVRFDNNAAIYQQLHVGGPVDFGNDGDVRRDGFIAGDVVANGNAQFHRTLTVDSQATVGSSVTYGQLKQTNVDVGEVCERCDASDRIPVGEIVSRRRGTNNDNDRINLDADVLASRNDAAVLELPCGEYYLSEITASEKVTIRADGRTALYIDGDVKVGSDLTIKATPSGELDVFVAGDVRLDNNGQIGDPAYPASTRFYVGGPGGWTMGSDVRIGAFLYTVPGGIVADNTLTVYGGIYTQTLDAGSRVDLHYDRAVLDAGKNCTPIEPDVPTPNHDAGSGDTSSAGDGSSVGSDGGGSDGSSGDTGDGTTPMCAESGESCSSDGDCCVPLVCGAAGACDVKKCRARRESCSRDADCCSGNCAQVDDGSMCIGS